MVASQAVGQENPAGSSRLETVTVTAQKRKQNLQDISVTVSAFSGDQLAELGTTDSAGLSNQAPGLVRY